MQNRKNADIRSSEISQYVYCPYSWWESLEKGVVESKEMAEGSSFHSGFMIRQGLSRRLNALKGWILAAAVFWILYLVLGLLLKNGA